MRNILIFALACSLLVGCAGNTPQPAGNQAGAVPAGSGNTTVPANPVIPENRTPAPPPENVSQGQPPAAKTYSAGFSGLAGMGIPLECSINYTYGGKRIGAMLYFGTDAEFRVESPQGVAQCVKTITVIRGTRQYVGCDGKQILVSCDWFKSNYDAATPGLASSFDFTNVPASDISCRDWAYDKSMFVTSGTVCEMG